MREALRRQLDMANPTAPTKSAPVAATPAVPSVPPPAVPANPANTAAQIEREAKENAAKAKAAAKAQAEADKKRAEEQKRIARENAKKPVPLPALPAVPSNLATSKSQRLAELLEKYRHDQLTPAEYHSQRAKILAEP